MNCLVNIRSVQTSPDGQFSIGANILGQCFSSLTLPHCNDYLLKLFRARSLGLLVDREMTDRLDRRLKNRLLQAKLKQNACLEDINYQADRGLDKALLQSLYDCQWIKNHLNPYLTHTINIHLKTISCAIKNIRVALHLEK